MESSPIHRKNRQIANVSGVNGGTQLTIVSCPEGKLIRIVRAQSFHNDVVVRNLMFRVIGAGATTISNSSTEGSRALLAANILYPLPKEVWISGGQEFIVGTDAIGAAAALSGSAEYEVMPDASA